MKSQNHSPLIDPMLKGEKSENQEHIIHRQGKYLYKAEKSDLLIQEFKSDEPVDIESKQKIKSLDVLRNEISSYLFEYLEGFHIPTHFVMKYSDTKMIVKRTDSIPISVKIFNLVNGNLMKRLGVKDVVPAEFPIIEHYLNNGQRSSSWINEYHVYALAIATPEEFKQINRIASKANAVLRALCDRRQLVLSDIQLEFGRYKGQIILTDELSPTTCRFLDSTIENKTKRDRFTLDKEDAVEAVTQLNNRLLLKV
ncbi:MAG: hypothetical protein HY800_02580 [Ignavibacteriales bacterium]|nr:hypothetical protein [Ignavibacteriales bacterium]